jgi:hypothetical protein
MYNIVIFNQSEVERNEKCNSGFQAPGIRSQLAINGYKMLHMIFKLEWILKEKLESSLEEGI